MIESFQKQKPQLLLYVQLYTYARQLRIKKLICSYVSSIYNEENSSTLHSPANLASSIHLSRKCSALIESVFVIITVEKKKGSTSEGTVK